MYTLAAAVGGLALLVAGWPLVPAAVVTALAFAGLFALGATLGALGSARSVTVDRFRLALRQLLRRYSLAFALDMAIVAASYYAALLLRLDPETPGGAAELSEVVQDRRFPPWSGLAHCL